MLNCLVFLQKLSCYILIVIIAQFFSIMILGMRIEKFEMREAKEKIVPVNNKDFKILLF